MEFQDKVLKCIDCGTDFVFTAVNSRFSTINNSKTSPNVAKPVRISGSPCWERPQQHGFAKTETRTNCSQCGKETTVPSVPPKDDRCYAGSAFSKLGALPAPEKSLQVNMSAPAIL